MNDSHHRRSAPSGVLLIIIGLLLAGCRTGVTRAPEATATAAPTPAAGVAYAWVQLGAQSAASARAIIAAAGAQCPAIAVDSQTPARMNPRTAPASYSGFQGITVCEYPLALPVKRVSIGGPGAIDLPPPTGASDKVLVIGDTGCRLKNGSGQWCRGGSLTRGQWGFPEIALAAAGSQPELILHVGDYLYRESAAANGTACDPYDPAKGWVDCGYNWATWEDDFFAPAQAGGLLTKAPWLYVRGNHEGCGRAWNGYFLFFYPGAVPSSCTDTVDPYAVNLDDLDVYMVDTSNESPTSAQASFTAVYNDLAGSTTRTWLATHVPTSDLTPAYGASKLPQRQALRWLHVGHVHHFEHYPTTDMRQAETVTGGSGTALDSCSGVTVCSLGGPDQCCYGKVSSRDAGEYSYLVVEWNSGSSQWDAKVHDVSGGSLHTFSVK